MPNLTHRQSIQHQRVELFESVRAAILFAVVCVMLLLSCGGDNSQTSQDGDGATTDTVHDVDGTADMTEGSDVGVDEPANEDAVLTDSSGPETADFEAGFDAPTDSPVLDSDNDVSSDRDVLQDSDLSSPVDVTSDFDDGDVTYSDEVHPYLQLASPSDIWILWETPSTDETRVEWGLTEALGTTTSGFSTAGSGGSRIHEVHLEGLDGATRYWYRVAVEDSLSLLYHFVTPPTSDAESPLRLVAFSDTQIDSSHPDKFDEIIHQGIIDFITAENGPDMAEHLNAVLVVGDLVENGTHYYQWQDHFFTPARDLMSRVPTYPTIGNHEQDSINYFKYFHLPENGSTGYEEHWWYHDLSNVRLIGLDTNSGYRFADQLDWLSMVLTDACSNEAVDFVFAQFHHPYRSELWLAGETAYSGDLIELLETFSKNCGKPSVHFFGHTHGYSRGQSLEVPHVWVNVATAAGNIDYWGEYAQADYDWFTVSQDAYGFAVIDVAAGSDPYFRIRRVSRGDELTPLDNIITDDITVHRYGDPPNRPTVVSPSGGSIDPEFVLLRASSYSDPNGVAHGASQWQVSTSCGDFTAPVYESVRHHENWYFDINTNARDDLTDEVSPDLDADTDYCWRVRYRNQGLQWSQWSIPVGFSTATSTGASNLLQNPGAEDGLTDWTVSSGVMESLTDGECGGASPRTGTRYFSVGGLCEHSASAEGYQRIDVSSYSSQIDAGEVTVVFGGYLRNWSGYDRPELELVFRDGGLGEITRSDSLGTNNSTWTPLLASQLAPSGTRTVDFVLSGTRHNGTDNDSYFDDLRLVLHLSD